jgi:hypothetical protein
MNLRDVGSETSVNDSVQTNKMINKRLKCSTTPKKMLKYNKNNYKSTKRLIIIKLMDISLDRQASSASVICYILDVYNIWMDTEVTLQKDVIARESTLCVGLCQIQNLYYWPQSKLERESKT